MNLTALRQNERIDHVRFGSSPAVLQTILEPEPTLVVWDRPPPIKIGSLRGFPLVRFAGAVEEVAQLLREQLAVGTKRAWHQLLVMDVLDLVQRYAAVVATPWVDIRLEHVTGNACWKFHTDYVSIRLISTYVGQATQWLDQDSAAAVKSGLPAAPHQLSPGSVGLFKGRAVAGDKAIVHRSPPIAGLGEERLLLVIDPHDASNSPA